MIKYLIIIPALLLLAVLAAVVRTLLRPRKKSDYKPHENEEERFGLREKLSEMRRYRYYLTCRCCRGGKISRLSQGA